VIFVPPIEPIAGSIDINLGVRIMVPIVSRLLALEKPSPERSYTSDVEISLRSVTVKIATPLSTESVC
jgi:hypothetical protein